MGQIDIRSIFHRLYEVITRRGAAVMALKIKLHPLLEIFLTQQRVDHANDFRTLFINGEGVEVIHFDYFIRADRMRHRAGVFREL